MSQSDPYKILGLSPGASERQIKTAYRRLALKYHPDRNPSEDAAEKFLAITTAYETLLDDRVLQDYMDRAGREYAREYIRKERRKAWERAEQKRKEKKEAEERFRKSELYDLILLLKYAGHGLLLVFSVLAIIVPFVLAVVIEPAVLLATIYFVIIGAFLLWHIYEKRSNWFRLGGFNTTPEKIRQWFKIPERKSAQASCMYTADEKADGHACKIELVKVVDVKVATFGVLNHEARVRKRTAYVVRPRSSRAQFWHRMSTLLKLISLLGCLVFFPVTSIIWRFIAGLFVAAVLSMILLRIVKVRPKSNYLLTPALIIKLAVWIGVMILASDTGPGFEIHARINMLPVVIGLFFLVDMVFDLVFGFFPFYDALFRPFLTQEKKMQNLYADGYQNYQELPFISLLFPFYKWVF